MATYVLLCVGGSIACSWWLHSAASRRDAAWLVPIALLWATVATLPALLRRPLPVPSLVTLAGVAIAVRAPLVGTPPLLSDDLYRYLWEGAVVAAGVNPYVTAPAEVLGLDEGLRSLVNHPELSTAYPPLAMLWFLVLHGLGGTPLTAQAATACLDVGIALGIAVCVARRRGPGWAAWIYAVHPLPALESAVGAHLDIVAIAVCVGALLTPVGPRPALATMAGSVKLLPFVWLPAWCRRARPGTIALAMAAGLFVGVGVPWLAGVPLPTEVPAGLRAYAASWSFNSLVFPATTWVLGPYARAFLVCLGGVATLTVVARKWRDPATPWLLVATIFLVLSPTVHPWYALWALVPALVLGRPAWVVGAGSMLAAYGVLATLGPTGWTEPVWLPLVTWGPLLLSAVWLERKPAAGLR